MIGKIVYHSPSDMVGFDIDRYFNSLSKYGFTDKDGLKKAIDKKYPNAPLLHYSCLITLGTELIQDDAEASRYHSEHPVETVAFERLRRITGYLVGSIERWNDAKQSEEKARVKHSI